MSNNNGLAASLAIDYADVLKDTPKSTIQKWGYGQVDVYIAIEDCAAAYEAELNMYDEWPETAAYRLPSYMGDIDMADPVAWFAQAAKDVEAIVDLWINPPTS